MSSPRNIGLERENKQVLSSYTSMNSVHQYEIDDDPSYYCQSTLKSLSIGQRQICLLHADHMPIIIQGKRCFLHSLAAPHISIESMTKYVRVLLQAPVKESTNANINFKIAIGTARPYATAASSDLFSTMVSSIRCHRA